jgi:trk system potassium uptake protein TrkH
MKSTARIGKIKSEKVILFSYFLSIIAGGTLLLSLPASWGGGGRLHPIDALFTATSAVCVTGLITVNTASFTILGKIIILLLIQSGGLGIISFATIYLARPEGKMSLAGRGVIRGYYLTAAEHEPRAIIRRIVIMTFSVEAAGALMLFRTFRHSLDNGSVLASVFHAVSAFCNAGFSLFPNSLEDYLTNANVSLTIIVLIILGGLGFVVLQDISMHWLGRKRRIFLHTRIVFVMTGLLVLGGTLLFLLFEYRGALAGLRTGQKLMAALFQAVTPRTAGFNTLPQSLLSAPSRLTTIFLMFTGGASGSIAGGVKVTTLFVVLLMAFQQPDAGGGITVFHEKITGATSHRAVVFMSKALLILFASIFLLTVSEHIGTGGGGRDVFALVFECFSAFGTVGLSLGITPGLSTAGKLIIIATMFLGRVGLIALAMPQPRQYPVHILDYPDGEVMIG